MLRGKPARLGHFGIIAGQLVKAGKSAKIDIFSALVVFVFFYHCQRFTEFSICGESEGKPKVEFQIGNWNKGEFLQNTNEFNPPSRLVPAEPNARLEEAGRIQTLGHRNSSIVHSRIKKFGHSLAW